VVFLMLVFLLGLYGGFPNPFHFLLDLKPPLHTVVSRESDFGVLGQGHLQVFTKPISRICGGCFAFYCAIFSLCFYAHKIGI